LRLRLQSSLAQLNHQGVFVNLLQEPTSKCVGYLECTPNDSLRQSVEFFLTHGLLFLICVYLCSSVANCSFANFRASASASPSLAGISPPACAMVVLPPPRPPTTLA